MSSRPAVVADALPGNHDSSLRDCLFEAQRAQRARSVARKVDTRPRFVPGRLPLDHLDREAGAGERSGGRETGDASPDYEDSRLTHLNAVPDYVDDGRTFRFARNRFTGSHVFLISARRSKLAP